MPLKRAVRRNRGRHIYGGNTPYFVRLRSFFVISMDYNTPFPSSAAFEDTVFACDALDVFSYFGFTRNDDLMIEYPPSSGI